MAKFNPKNLWLLAALIIILGAGIGGGWWLGNRNKKSSNTTNQTPANDSQTPASTQTTTPPTTTTTPTPLDKSIEAKTAESLFQKCQTNNISNTTDWADSPAYKLYADFNIDNIEDVLVWAKLPGTMGYAQGCVYTIQSGSLKNLWRLKEADFLPQSSFSVNAQNELVYSGKQTTSGGITDTFVLYKWIPSKNTFDPQD